MVIVLLTVLVVLSMMPYLILDLSDDIDDFSLDFGRLWH